MAMAQQGVPCLLKNDVIYNVMPSNESGMTNNMQKIPRVLGQMHVPIYTYMHAHRDIYTHNKFCVTFKLACFSRIFSTSFLSISISFCLDETPSFSALISAFLWITSLQSSSQFSFNCFIFLSASFKK